MYAKVFTQILDSSLAENFHVRHMFEDLLKLCDPNGVVDMTHASIARRLKMPEKSVRLWIGELQKPDPSSRTPYHEGRRIVLLDDHRDWGWFIVNHAHYRQLASEEQRREKTRIRTEKWRKKNDGDAPVTLCDAGDAMQKQRQMQKQMEGEAEIPPSNEKLGTSERITLEQSLKRIVKDIDGLKDADIPQFVERRRELKAEKTRLLGILGLKA